MIVHLPRSNRGKCPPVLHRHHGKLHSSSRPRPENHLCKICCILPPYEKRRSVPVLQATSHPKRSGACLRGKRRTQTTHTRNIKSSFLSFCHTGVSQLSCTTAKEKKRVIRFAASRTPRFSIPRPLNKQRYTLYTPRHNHRAYKRRRAAPAARLAGSNNEPYREKRPQTAPHSSCVCRFVPLGGTKRRRKRIRIFS